jgi:hypothetical protein
MPDVSPLIDKLPFQNYTSQEIWSYFYEGTKDRITNFSEIQGEGKIVTDHLFLYTSSDSNRQFDKGEKFRFFLTRFSSEDDSLLEALYPKLTPLDNEIIILVENNSTDVFSGASYYIKLGDNLHNRILDDDNFFTADEYRLITNLPSEFKTSQYQFDKETFKEAIKTIKQKGAGKYTDPSMYQLLQGALLGLSFANPNASFGLYSLNKLIIKLLDDGIEGLNNSKYTSKEWNFSHSDKQIKLPFFPRYSAYRNSISHKEIHLASAAIGTKIKANLNNLNKNFKGQPQSIVGFSLGRYLVSNSFTNMPERFAGTVLSTLTSTNISDEISNTVEDFVNETAKLILNMVDNGYIFMNALLCGFVNSLLSTIEGLLFIIKLPFWLMDKSLSMLLANPEKMDETVQVIVRFDFAEAKKQFWKFLGKIIDKISKFNLSDFLSSIGIAHVGYFIGCIIEFIVEIIIGAITFGTYSVSSIVSKVGNVFKSLIETLFKIVRKFYKVTKGVTVDIASALLQIFRSGVDEFARLLNEIWQVISKWINDLLGFTRTFDEIYDLLYVRPKGLHKKLSRRQVYRKYGPRGRRLFDVVEKQYEKELKNASSGNELGRKVLVSGMIDKKTGKVSKTFSNFTDKEIRQGKHTEFIKKLHPTLRKRLEEHIKRAGKGGKGLNLEDSDVYKYAWKSPDNAHAEFQALDDILKKIDPKGLLGEKAIERVIGYNSFLRKPGIQYTCADCFYLTNGVTFII